MPAHRTRGRMKNITQTEHRGKNWMEGKLSFNPLMDAGVGGIHRNMKSLT